MSVDDIIFVVSFKLSLYLYVAKWKIFILTNLNMTHTQSKMYACEEERIFVFVKICYRANGQHNACTCNALKKHNIFYIFDIHPDAMHKHTHIFEKIYKARLKYT